MSTPEKTSASHIHNAYETARRQIRNACDMFDECRVDNDLYEMISHPHRIIEVNIPIRLDNGTIRMFTGFRSQHSNARGPYKGGIRFHENVTREEVKALSMWMSIKCAVLDLPLWGGKGGIIVNPKELSVWELERLSRGYVRELYKYLGPETDVPAPDVNTNPQIMAWMMDEYSKLVGHYTPGAFTGKPLEVGGSKWRGEATAQGGIFVLTTFLELQNESIVGKKVLIEWAGNAGLTMAKLIVKAWGIVVGISDSGGAIYDENGLSVDEIIRMKTNKQSVTAYSGVQSLSPDELLLQKADILIPAALENRLTSENTSKLQVRLVLELANGPTTVEADEILFARGIPVIPDILANAGGVTVSYFEQVQNTMNFYWTEEEIAEKLEKRMRQSTKEVYEISKKHASNLRAWAYIIALKRILDAMRIRGTV